MRKVNSKATLQPSNSGNASTTGMSPSQTKQQSMIKLYKVQSQPQNVQPKVNVNIQPSNLIAKNIQARRQQFNNNNHNGSIQNRTNHNITMLIQQDPNNNSVQTVKPSTIFSPGDAINRKNETLGTQKNPQWDKQSPQLRQKLFLNSEYNTVSPKTNDLYANMKKQLEKQRSLQSLFNTTQKLNSQATLKPTTQQSKTSRNNQQLNTLDSQRAVLRRGAKYQTHQNSGYNSVFNNSSTLNTSLKVPSNPNQIFMFKNNLSSMTRNKSAFLNFNSTQPVSNKNKTEIDLRMQDKNTIQIVKNMPLHNQSPSISSEEDKDVQEEAKIKDFNVHIEKPEIKLEIQKPLTLLGSHQKKRSQLPNGSFIETKMKNCLHSRNNEQSSQAYQTYQGTLNQKAILVKNQSQPHLYQQKNMNLTQRATFVKTSFLRHDDSRSVTPMNAQSSKSPQGQSTRDDKLSTISQTKKIQGLKGDLKSLNLSPIVPQNLGKNQHQFQRETSHSEYNRTNIASAQKRLQMRKQSVNSNQNNKPYSSLKKDRSTVDISKHQNVKDDPTTEKKKDPSIKTMKFQKPGCSSQETERGPGATNSYSTADDFNVISNESQSQFVLRFKNEGSQGRQMFRQDLQKQYKSQLTDVINIQDESHIQQKTILDKTQESKIKVTQILNNNNLSSHQNRYNLNLTPDEMFVALPNQENNQVLYNKTPKAFPYMNDDTMTFNHQQNSTVKILIPNEDDRTLKKHQFEDKKSESSFDEEEEMPDAKDFEEFDRPEKSCDSSKSLKVRVQIIDQDMLFKEVKNQNNFLHNYNNAASFLINYNQSNFYEQKDDRNSLVNYDTSLLTHNTGRDNNSSPISELRDNRQKQSYKLNQKNKAHEYTQIIPDSSSFIVPTVQQELILDIQVTKTDDGYCDVDLQNRLMSQEDDSYHDDFKDSNTQHYKKIMSQVQKEEEKEIEKFTARIFSSQKYKIINSEKERVKYLSQQIAIIRNKYKKVLIDRVLSQQ